MITKQQFKQLIKKGATLYYADADTILGGGMGVAEHNPQNKDSIYESIKNKEFTVDQFYDENWFETKEEAEWHLQHTHRREVRLELIHWKRFKYNYINNFYGKKCLYRLFVDKRAGFIVIIEILTGKSVFCGEATKQNYIKACDLCKKLFYGEDQK